MPIDPSAFKGMVLTGETITMSLTGFAAIVFGAIKYHSSEMKKHQKKADSDAVALEKMKEKNAEDMKRNMENLGSKVEHLDKTVHHLDVKFAVLISRFNDSEQLCRQIKSLDERLKQVLARRMEEKSLDSEHTRLQAKKTGGSSK